MHKQNNTFLSIFFLGTALKKGALKMKSGEQCVYVKILVGEG